MKRRGKTIDLIVKLVVVYHSVNGIFKAIKGGRLELQPFCQRSDLIPQHLLFLGIRY